MTHLSREELLDAAEKGSARRPHLEECEACRRQADALADVLRDVRGDTAPEPSPLFWDNLSRRVSDAIAAERAADAARPRRAGWRPSWRRWRLLAPVGAAACVLALVVATMGRAPIPGPGRAPAVASSVTAPSSPVPASAVLPDDEAWRALTEIVDAEADSDAGAVSGSDLPGGAEAAAQRLSDEEQLELVRLLRAATAVRTPGGEGRGSL